MRLWQARMQWVKANCGWMMTMGICTRPIIVQTPVGMPSPPKPTAIEVALHWLTHLPYRSWCRWCVSAKRRNAPQHGLPSHSREVPLLVADYCFLRDARDEDLLTCSVGQVVSVESSGFPSRVMPRASIPTRLGGSPSFCEILVCLGLYTCVTKRRLLAMIQSAMEELSGTSTWVGGVRERSAVGEVEYAVGCFE